MRRLSLILFLLLFLGLEALFAQTKVITGKVIGSDGDPIPGATVLIKGTSTGVVTDLDGNYSLQVPTDATAIQISYLGYQTQELALGAATAYDAKLESESINIDEVVVTALGIRKEVKTLGYSATQVKGDEIAKSGQTSAMAGLQGKVAGLTVSSNSGTPGASTKVIVRGYASISGSNSPLYIVDGVPIDNSSSTGSSTGLDFGNGASAVNPDDIESINVLKGAAATALYGNRASSGAIIITTKRGKSGDKISVNFTSNTAFSTPLRLPQMQNTWGQGWSGHFDSKENGSWGPKLDGQNRLWGNVVDNSQQLKPFSALEDNLKDFYDIGTSFYNSVAVSGGSDKSNHRLSISSTKQDGMIPTDVDSYNRKTFAYNGMGSFDKLVLSVGANAVFRNGSASPDGNGGTSSAANLFSEILQIPRDISIVDHKDYKGNKFANADNYFTPYAYNPYYALNENKSNFEENRFFGNFGLVYNFTDWISASWKLGTDFSNFSRSEQEAILNFTPGSPQALSGTKPNTGFYLEERINRSEYTNLLMVNFKRPIVKDVMNIDGSLGYDAREANYSELISNVTSLVIPGYYNLANTTNSKNVTTYESQRRIQAAYASLTFDYKNFAYVTVTGRNDWSSTLPIDNNSFFYPSVSGSFIVSEFLKDYEDVVSFAKLRASWGKSGKDASPYRVNSVMNPGSVNYPYATDPTPRGYKFPLAGVSGFTVGNNIGNADLSPEISTEWEIGANVMLWKKRLTIDVAYYNKLTDGQILTADLAPSTGYYTQTKNFGKIENTGLELVVDGRIIDKRDFSWDLGINYTLKNNKVLELSDELNEFYLTGRYNTELYAIAGQPLGAIKVPGIQKDDQGRTIVNPATGFAQATTDKEVIGSIQERYRIGAQTSLKYKGWDLGASIDIRNGGMMYSGVADLMYFVGNATQTSYNDRQPFIIPNSVMPNPAKTDASLSQAERDAAPAYIENTKGITSANVNNPYYYPSTNLVSERDRVIPKDFVKLREVRLAYSFPKSWLKVIKVEDLTLAVIGTNLLLWTPEDNNFVDPETTSFGNDLLGEFGEFRTGPTPRTYTFGLNVKF